MNCNWLSRYNVCQMEGIALDTGVTFRRSMKVFPCFHKAFWFINTHSSHLYRITYKLHIKKKCDGVRNNFAFLDKKGMCRLLNSFKMIIPFKYHFEDTPTKYIVIMTLEGTGLQHKGLLMLSRSLFEFPHNLCGYDAIRLRDLKVVDGVDFTKIPLYYLYLTGISSTGYTGDECFIRHEHVKLITTSELKEKLNTPGQGAISLVMPYNNLGRERIRYIADDGEITNENLFTTRTKIYIRNYNKSLRDE